MGQLSLVLLCRQCTGTAWDTVPIWEQKWPAILVILVFSAGMPAKLTRVQPHRDAGSTALQWLLLLAAHNITCVKSSPGGTGRYITDTSAAYENQALGTWVERGKTSPISWLISISYPRLNFLKTLQQHIPIMLIHGSGPLLAIIFCMNNIFIL